MPFVATDRSLIVIPPAEEPLTLDQVKLRAGQDWLAGDPRDALLQDYIAAARDRVEQDTGWALLTQTRDAFVDPVRAAWSAPVLGVQLGTHCVPVQSVTTISTVGPDGTLTPIDPAGYLVDRARGRIALGAPWTPLSGSLGAGLVIRVVAGWLTPADLAAAAPGLVQAVGLLAVHYFTAARDVVNIGHMVAEVPYGYDEALAAYRQVSLL